MTEKVQSRTLDEILTIAHDGGRPEYDDLLYALLVMDALSIFDFSIIAKLAFEALGPERREQYAEESFQRRKRSLAIAPHRYLGWEHDPVNSEHQRERQIALRLWNKVSGTKD